ncbi:hypothetical protein B0H16DRAFT_1699454 [Mycena metata]|uniref:Uncharacterized protein n=1 Tax=Mycena metata TaxID=1033252 RepID=A0AAD7MKP9_9AGAR|nr:hypothetical protein B0H16DRAFT_1699454 [Mycena metata]
MPKKTRYATRASRRRSSSPVKKSSKDVFDDEARDSEDGVMVDKNDLAAEDESEGYEADFIDDRDLGEDKVFGTPDLTPPPPGQIGTRLDAKSHAASGSVIEVESSEEDMAAIAADDRVVLPFRLALMLTALYYSMFRRPSAVKATALPPSLLTRSKRSMEDATAPFPVKKAKRGDNTLPASGSSSRVAEELVRSPASFDKNAMAKFMASWMEDFLAKQGLISQPITPPKPTRIDFDQVELDRGLAASRAELDKQSPTVKSKEAARSSPVWDIEDDSDVPVPVASKGKGKSVASKAVVLKSQLTSFVTRGRKGATQAAVNSALGNTNMTMGKFFKEHTSVLVDETSGSRANSVSDSGDPPSTAFLEDLETYKNFFDPDAPCGVYDPDIQDPALAMTYRKLPPLPAGRRILPAYDPSRATGGSHDADTKGGRAKFSSWKNHIKSMLARNCIGAMLFVECKPNFINPSRVSPLCLSRQASAGTSGTQRLMYDGQIAVCLSAVFCTDSVVVTAGKIGGKSERMRKWVSGIFHNQDWERFESLMCLVFGQDILYAQISNKKAISFQTMISPEGASAAESSDTRFNKNAPSDMFSPIIPKKSTPSKAKARPSGPGTPSKTLLAYNEHLPVYDARKTPFDFEFDLPRISTLLPSFTGEIPFSSFVVVGYTVSTYNGSLGGTTERVTHLGCNVVWVVVCGTPTLRK